MWFPFSRSSSSLISSSLTSSAKQNQVGLEKFRISAAPWEVNPCWNPHQASVSPGQQMLPAGNTALTNSLGIGMWAAKLIMNICLLIGIYFKEKHPAIRACSCAFSLLIIDKNSCTQTSLLNFVLLHLFISLKLATENNSKWPRHLDFTTPQSANTLQSIWRVTEAPELLTKVAFRFLIWFLR